MTDIDNKFENIAVESHGLHADHVVSAKYADIAVGFMQVHDSEVPDISSEQDRALTKKVLWRVLGLTFLINMIMYMDKATLSYTAITGFWEATNLTQNQYNNVNTIFYVGFIVGQLPGTYLLQKLPIGKLMFGITLMWSIVIFLHCTAYNYAGVIVLRFFLGFFESVSIPLLTTANGMFLSQHLREMTQPIFYASCMASPIPIGFLSYGVIYAHASIGDWRVLNIIIGGLTLILSVIVYFFFPDNPLNASFLSVQEKVWVIRKVQGTSHSSIEQKHFKKHHAIEALKDPISWLLCGFFLLQQLANNLTYQQNILYEEMGGLSNLNSTLVSVAGAGFALSLVGSIVAVALPLSNSIGELAAISMASSSFGVGWICALGLAQTTAGSSYTKRLTRNAMVMLWQERDAPRRNKVRKTQLADKVESPIGAVKNEDGDVYEVNIAALDLTDLEDKSFIYPT
ncbi:Major facilitator superfamily (MFS) profile domain-containing protein [[Candida] zeylanoides]